jgi:hypothetical protein
MKTWTKKQERLVEKHYPTMPTPKLAALLGMSVCAVKTKAGKMGVKKLIHSNNPYTPEKKALLFKLYPNTTNREIAQILGVTEASVIGAGFRFGLRKTKEFLRLRSEKGMFKKGQEPPNKGRKWSEYMTGQGMKNSRKTTFKKGTVPPNQRPVGYERISKDGYTEVKVGEGLRQFRLKHRVVWEQHFGPIPKGCNVQFRDGDKTNFDPSNLVLMTKAQNMGQNTYHNYPKEIANTIQLIGALNRQINKRKTA